MGEVSTIGMDLAKSVFQVHGADALGAVLLASSQIRSWANDGCGSQPYFACCLRIMCTTRCRRGLHGPLLGTGTRAWVGCAA